MNAPLPPFPSNPAVGQFYLGWFWNGTQWVFGGLTGFRLNVLVFTTSGIYTPTAGLTTTQVECIGGGGAGGAASSPNALWTVAGGGGGSGGYSRKSLPVALVAGGVVVTVGGGGIGDLNVAGPPHPTAVGGVTSFGALCIANGGGGGYGNDAGNVGGVAGYPAAAGVGDLAWPGAAGFNGALFESAITSGISASGGQGGWTQAGGTITNAIGDGMLLPGYSANPNTGCGGGGACSNRYATVNATEPGGNGGSGICIVTEYIMGAAEGSCCPPFNPCDGARVELGRWEDCG